MVFARLPPLLQRFLVHSRTLRFQLAFSILLILVPGFLFSAFIINRIALDRLRQITLSRMAGEADLISFAIRRWADSNRQTLKLLASQQAMQDGDIDGIKNLFTTLDKLYPNREWRYWTGGNSPRLSAYTGGNITQERITAAQQRILERPYFRDALQGRPGYAIVNSFASGESCLMFAQPIPIVSNISNHVGSPSGVLLSCILLRNLSRDTDLKSTLSHFNYFRNVTKESLLDSSSSFNAMLMLVSNQGHVLFPAATFKDVDSIPLVTSFIDTPWWPLLSQTISKTDDATSLDSLSIGANRYLVAASRADYQWSTIMIINDQVLYADLHNLRITLFFTSFISFFMVVLATQFISKKVVSPVQLAGDALKHISAGDFDMKVPVRFGGEMGELLHNVNATSQKLKDFLASETHHASTRKQLETAREIQKDFLPTSLPFSDIIQISATCIPAYDVGADWYDSIRVGNTIYIIVADVCDKGIPSALYMSVFRTLTRHILLQGKDHLGDSGIFLETVLSTVNSYMVSNHGESAMFATMFLASLDETTGILTYVLAGHEPPMIVCPDEVKWLQLSGPAVGIFSGISFEAHAIELTPKTYVLAYTDGLIDSRSELKTSWGDCGFPVLSDYIQSSSPGADELIGWLLHDIASFSEGSEQFDDLTLLAIRWK